MITKATQIGSRIAIAALISLASGSAAVAQPCNPVIDGTYCADNMPKRSPKARATPSRSNNLRAIEPIRDPTSAYQDTPGTFGGISFGNTGTNCVGLGRRSNCK